VHHLQWRIGFIYQRKLFGKTGNGGPAVQMHRCLRYCGQPEHCELFISRRSRRIWKSCADAHRALTQTNLHQFHDLGDLFRRRVSIRSVAHWQERAGIAHHRHPHLDVTNADAVVDSLAGTSLAIPRVDIRRSNLELERCRHAIERSVPVDLRCLSMIVQVDEARRDDKPARVDRVSPLDGFSVIIATRPVEDPDVGDRVEIRVRIHHATAENHAIHV
jgi:hypothetical protein